jgi:hypothetical protein
MILMMMHRQSKQTTLQSVESTAWDIMGEHGIARCHMCIEMSALPSRAQLEREVLHLELRGVRALRNGS